MRIRAEFREKAYHAALKIRQQNYEVKSIIKSSDDYNGDDIERIELNVGTKNSSTKNRNSWVAGGEYSEMTK